MKYLLYWLLIAPVFAFADESPVELEQQVPANNPAETPSPNRYSIGFHTVDFDYKEPGLMSDRGYLHGLAFAFHRTVDVDRSFKFTAEYVQGTTFYDGALQTNTGVKTPYTSNEKFRIINTELSFTRRLAQINWSQTWGVGYRNTFDSKTNQYDYRRDITYYYLFFGTPYKVYDKKNIQSTLNLEASYLMGGGAKTYLSDVSSSYRDVDFKFQTGLALKIGLETFFSAFDNHRFVVDVSYKTWIVPDSRTEYIGNGSYGVEPHNTTGLLSLTAAYVF